MGPYKILVLQNASQESPLICHPIEPLADKSRQELLSGCIWLRPMWCLTILSPFRTKRNRFCIFIYVGKLDFLKLTFIVPYPAPYIGISLWNSSEQPCQSLENPVHSYSLLRLTQYNVNPPYKLSSYKPNTWNNATLNSQLLKMSIKCGVRFYPAWCNQALTERLIKLNL